MLVNTWFFTKPTVIPTETVPEVSLPTTTEPESQTTVATEPPTTTTETPTTTVPPTTTTTIDPGLPSLNVGLGLRVGPSSAGGSGTSSEALVIGELRDIYQRKIEFLGEEVDTWMVSVYFGRHSVTDEEIVGEFLLGRVGESEYLIKYVVSGQFANFSTSGGPTSARLTADEIVEFLVVGNRYGFRIWLEISDKDFNASKSASCPGNPNCEYVPETLQYMPYNAEVVELLLGESVELSPDEFGPLSLIYFAQGTK